MTTSSSLKGPKVNYSAEVYNFYNRNFFLEGMQNNTELYEKVPEIKTFNEKLNSNPSLRRIYNLAIENIHSQSYRDAIFFVDKLMTLMDAHPLIIYLLGECYFANADYKKVHSLFVKHKLINYNQNFQVLAARSLVSFFLKKSQNTRLINDTKAFKIQRSKFSTTTLSPQPPPPPAPACKITPRRLKPKLVFRI
jgi:hypothetical protein